MLKLKEKIIHVWNAYDEAVWIRAFGTALTSLTNFMMRPFLVLYLYDRLNGSILLSMIVVALSPLMGVLVNLFAGGLSDKVGRKPVILVSLLIQAVSMVALMAASNVWHFAIISVFIGIGHALFGPAASAQITDVVPEEKRQEVFALFHTALNLGAAVGPLVGLLLYSWNMQVVFLICAISTVLFGALVWWKIPETLPASQPAEGTGERRKSVYAGIRLSEHKTLIWLSLFAMPVTLLYAQVEATFPLHLQTRFEDFKTIFATLMTFNGFMVILMQMWVARKTKDLPAHRILGVSYVLFALVSLGYGYAPWFILLLAVEFAFTLGEMMYGPHIQKLVSVIAPPEHRGFYFSIFGMNFQLSRAVGPVIGGLLFSSFGGPFLFATLAVVILVSGCFMAVLARRVAQPAAASSGFSLTRSEGAPRSAPASQ